MTINTVVLRHVYSDEVPGYPTSGVLLSINGVQVEHMFDNAAMALKHVVEHYLDAEVLFQ